MTKKIISMSLIFLFLMPSLNVLAFAVYEQTGIGTSIHYDASKDVYSMEFSGTNVVSVDFASYTDSSYSTPITQRHITAQEQGGAYYNSFYFNCNRYYKATFYDSGGTQVAHVKFQATQVANPVCNSGANQDNVGGNPGCDSCAVLQCPEWDKYMGKVDQIIGKIPPPPDWQNVSEIFRDTIAPRIKADMADLLGKAPELPAIPDLPTIDQPKLETPEGKEDPALGNSTFDANDIKKDAPVIQENQDPTGGFQILDPIEQLPSQEEFMKNIPKEGDLTPPEVPDPPAQFPANPKEPENLAPTPSDDIGGPPTPDEGSNKAPIPNESGTAPLPGDSGGIAPLPNESGTAPLPNESGTAPLPNK